MLYLGERTPKYDLIFRLEARKSNSSGAKRRVQDEVLVLYLC